MTKRDEAQPDLWSVRGQGIPSPRPLLPHDLAASLRHLSDEELNRLAEAVDAERASRGSNSPQRVKTQDPARRRAPRASGASGATAAPPLTAAQVSLIRASIKAGVKPAVLSRQFGISRAQIRTALETG